jgi:hypothetical protein
VLAPFSPWRRGATLLEILVTTIIGGLALTLITMLCVREQRVFADLAEQSASYAQLRDAEAILPIDVRMASSVGGDVREARDTSLELRETIASAVACDTAAGGVVLAPATADAYTYSSFVSSVSAGDTAWLLVATDSSDGWRPYRVASSAAFRPGPCAALGPRLASPAIATARTVVVLDSLSPALALGAPLRVTRPLRYSLYRGTDGRWYLGQRDWNSVTSTFNSIQPVSGPFRSPALGGLEFRYLDSAGGALSAPVTNTRAIAAVLANLRSDTKSATRALASAGQRGARVDSAALWILLRNRR